MQKIDTWQICLLIGLSMSLLGFVLYRAIKYNGGEEETEITLGEAEETVESEYEEQDLEELSPAKLAMYKRSLDMCTNPTIKLTGQLTQRCMIVTGKLKQHGYSYNPTTKQITKV